MRAMALITVVAAGCTGGASGPAVTDGGTWVVDWASETPPDSGVPWTTTFTVADGAAAPVEGLTLVIEPFHPSMGHGIFEDPVVDDLGGGAYTATWTFNMTGLWEVRVDVSDENTTERAVLEVEVR